MRRVEVIRVECRAFERGHDGELGRKVVTSGEDLIAAHAQKPQGALERIESAKETRSQRKV